MWDKMEEDILAMTGYEVAVTHQNLHVEEKDIQ